MYYKNALYILYKVSERNALLLLICYLFSHSIYVDIIFWDDWHILPRSRRAACMNDNHE